MIKSPRGHLDINKLLHCNLFIYYGPIKNNLYFFEFVFLSFTKQILVYDT